MEEYTSAELRMMVTPSESLRKDVMETIERMEAKVKAEIAIAFYDQVSCLYCEKNVERLVKMAQDAGVVGEAIDDAVNKYLEYAYNGLVRKKEQEYSAMTALTKQRKLDWAEILAEKGE